MPQESNKSRIAMSLHSLVFVFLALVIALSSQFVSRAWFSNNDKVQAKGLSISAERAGLLEEIHYFRATETRLLSSAAGEKYTASPMPSRRWISPSPPGTARRSAAASRTRSRSRSIPTFPQTPRCLSASRCMSRGSTSSP